MVKTRTQASTLMVIPTLGKRLDLLEKTLQSCAMQPEGSLDLIVVVPLKNTEAVALSKQYGAEVADDPGTLSGAINVGIAQAKPHHKYLTWMGDDDLLRPDSIATSVAALEKHPHAVLAYGYCDYIDDDDDIIFTSRAGKLAPWIMSWGPNLVPLPGMLYRMSALKKAGDFDTSLKYAMDLDMLLRLRKLGQFVNTGRTLAAFRWHSSSTTVANRTSSLIEAELVKRRHLPGHLRPLAPLWEVPVRAATHVAARRVSAKARG